ncbi:MAG TPA: hypothetical protein VFR41_04570, partial [Acidimicrobiia bacterium]|nr:hypothetical protein [Acidimicrobiia bacterium]
MERFFVRMRHGAPAAVLVAVVLSFLIQLRVGATSTAAVRLTLGAAALCWFLVGLALRARAWRIADMPVSKVRAAAVGECEFSGSTQAPQPQPAPGSGIPCAWYRWELQHYINAGKSSHWRTEEKQQFEQPFWVTDDTGSIWVDPRGAQFDGIAREVLAVPDRRGRWRQLEWRLADRAPVYVMGQVSMAENGRLFVSGGTDSDVDFLISDDSKRTVAVRMGRWAWLSLALAGVAAVFTPILTGGTSYNDYDGKSSASFGANGSRIVAVMVAVAYLATLALTWLVRMYNRLVIVRNQAQKAWASI